jgi:hypothetical protein
MKDEFERHALLSYLGHVLQVLARICEKQSVGMTIGDLIERNPMLADEPLLEYLDCALLVEEFIARVLRAFCLWPEWLLEGSLDRKAFPATVHDQLFKDNQTGWKLYAAVLRSEVECFDVSTDRHPKAADTQFDPVIAPTTNEQQAIEPFDEANEPDGRALSTDIERGCGAEPMAENVEGLTPLDQTGHENQQLLDNRP